MIGFFIKKAFFDGWDNLLSIVLVNVLFIALLAVGYGAFALLRISSVLGIIVLILWYLLMHAAYGGVSFFTREYAWYQRPGFEAFRDSMRQAFRASMVLAGVDASLILMGAVIIPFYLSLGNIFGTVIVALLFWLLLTTLISLNYYLPLCSQLQDRPIKALKKSFIIFLDNVGFSIFLGIYTLIEFVLSLVTAFLIPSVTGIALSHQIAVKLLIYKYDYLEQESDADRKHIPWGALLFEEKERVGQRSLKGMIFPWKD